MSGSIPLVQTTDSNLNQMQQNFSQAINPVLDNPLVNGSILTGIKLNQGNNSIPHGLARVQQGWFLVDQNASASIYRTQNFNSSTLSLNSSAPVTVNIYVF